MKELFSSLHSPLDCWYCCQPDIDKQDYELCKIIREKVKDEDTEHGWRIEYQIITYYEGKCLLAGSLSKCKEWINSHWTERRYLDQYGKETK